MSRVCLSGVPSGPLSADARGAHCRELAQIGVVASSWVQVRKRGATLCGQLVGSDRFGGRDWHRVQTCIGVGWFPDHLVRACGDVDGRCHCNDRLGGDVDLSRTAA